MAEKLELDLSLVLPEIPDERDACVGRLTELLQAEGLEKVEASVGYAAERLRLGHERNAIPTSHRKRLLALVKRRPAQAKPKRADSMWAVAGTPYKSAACEQGGSK